MTSCSGGKRSIQLSYGRNICFVVRPMLIGIWLFGNSPRIFRWSAGGGWGGLAQRRKDRRAGMRRWGMQKPRSCFPQLLYSANNWITPESPKMGLDQCIALNPPPWPTRKRHRDLRVLCGRLSGFGWGGLRQRAQVRVRVRVRVRVGGRVGGRPDLLKRYHYKNYPKMLEAEHGNYPLR